jgi:hypothetical protein
MSDASPQRQQPDQPRIDHKPVADERDQAVKPTPEALSDEAAESVRLHARMAELLGRFEAKRARETSRPMPASPPPPPGAPGASPYAPLPTPVRPAEALQSAQAQFRAGQFDPALSALRRIDPAGLSKEDRVLVRYLTAGCLRGLGRLDEASAVYREVAASRDDETLAESARWQLEAIEGRQNMQRQLDELRSRRGAQ